MAGFVCHGRTALLLLFLFFCRALFSFPSLRFCSCFPFGELLLVFAGCVCLQVSLVRQGYAWC